MATFPKDGYKTPKELIDKYAPYLKPIGDGVYKFTPKDPVKVTIHSCTVEVAE